MAALHGLRSEVGNQPDKTAGYQSGSEFDAIMSLLNDRMSAERSDERTNGWVMENINTLLIWRVVVFFSCLGRSFRSRVTHDVV